MNQAMKHKDNNPFSFMWKLLSFFRVLRHLALVWHHPVAALSGFLFLLLLTTPLMRPLVRFFFPLFAFTILCIIAFISFGSLLGNKDGKGSEEAGDHITGLDVLGLGEGTSYHGFRFHIISKQEDCDLHSLHEKIESTNESSYVGSGFDDKPKEEVKVTFLEKTVEENKLPVQLKNELDDMHREENAVTQEVAHNSELKQEGAIFSSLAVPKKERRRKIRVRFVDEVEYLHGQARNKQKGSELCNGFHSDMDISEEDDHSIFREGSQEISSHEDGSFLFAEETTGNPSHATDIDNTPIVSDEHGHDSRLESQIHEATFPDAKDDRLIAPEVKMEEERLGINVRAGMEVEMNEAVAYLDDASNFHQDHPEGGAKYESDLKQDAKEFQIKDKINSLNFLNCDPCSSAEFCVDSHSETYPKPESEPKQEIDRELVINEEADLMGLPQELDREVKSLSITEQKLDLRQDVDSQIAKSSQVTVLGHDKTSAASLNGKLQFESKQQDDLRQEAQKWRDWIMGVETGVMSVLFKSADRNTACPDYGQGTTGIVTLEEESTSSGAFTFAEENEDTPLEALGSFIQKLTEKLQALEAGSIQKKGMNEFANPKSVKNTMPVQSVIEAHVPEYTVKEDAAKVNFNELSPRAAVTPDDSNTEGDASSRWDEVLDTSEKDSVDSEIEEGKIWPAPESDELGMDAIEKEFGILKFDCSELEKEYRALQDEIRFPGSLKMEDDDKFSEEDLDPYVKLFAQSAFADAEVELPTLPDRCQEHQAPKLPQKPFKFEPKSNNRSVLCITGLFGKPSLSSISKAIKSIKRLKKQW